MMGSRGYRGGDECEAFYSRRFFPYRRRKLRLIKRKFSKRMRRWAKQQAQRDATAG